MSRLLLLLSLFVWATDPVLGQGRIRQPIRDFPQPAPEPTKPELQVPADTNPDPKSLEYGEAELSKARSLARQLGSREYKEREQASRELGKIGRAAVIALREIRATETNPEVRLRVDILLPRAESDDMRARVLCFLADKDGKFDHKMPGWTKFKDIAGTDKASRELFAEVLKKSEYHSLLMACELSAHELGSMLSNYYQAMQQKQNYGFNVQPGPAELAVLSFLECQYPEKDMHIQGQWGPISVGQFLYHAEVQNAMRNGSGKYGQALQRIVGKWMDSRESAFGVQQAMNVATNCGMKDQLRYSAKMLMVKEPNYQWAKAQAASQIAVKDNSKDGKDEAKKYLPNLVKGLEDNAVLTQVFVGGQNPNAVVSVNTQDYILGILCRVTKQKPADYGLEQQIQGQDNFQNYANWYFKDGDKKKAAEKRDEGIKKFKEWAEKNIVAEPVKKDEPGKKDEPKKEAPKKDDGKKPEEKKDEPKQEAPAPPPVPTPLPIKK